MMEHYLIPLFHLQVFFPQPSLSHCCHGCIWQQFSVTDDLNSDFQTPDFKNIRGCSLDCKGDVLDDGTCSPGGPQVFRKINSINISTRN